MRIKKLKLAASILLSLFIPHMQTVWAWYDETHLAVAQAAGYYKWYNTTGADIAKVKAGTIESYNHFFNNPLNVDVTPSLVFSHVARYNNPRHEEGHLYGSILASLREYKNAINSGKYAEYHLAFCAHYITDLSQPLHNIPYDDFNRTRHATNDGTVENEGWLNIDRIKKHMYPITLMPDHFEKDLARNIARVANLSRRLGLKLKKENRNMTKEEAYIQLGHSASLLEAVVKHFGKRGK